MGLRKRGNVWWFRHQGIEASTRKTNRKQAEKFLEEIKARYEEGGAEKVEEYLRQYEANTLPSKKVSVAEIAEMVLNDIVLNNNSTTYVKNMRFVLSEIVHHIVNVLKINYLSNVKEIHLLEYARLVRESGRSDHSVRVRLIAFGMMWKKAIKESIISNQISPADGLTKKLKLRIKEMRSSAYIPSEEELNRVEEICPDGWLQTFRVLRYTGMREGEPFKLEKSDVDFERGLITIRRGKTGSRQISFPRVIEEDLKAILEGRGFRDLIKQLKGKTKAGGLCKKVGVPDFSAYDIRRAFITQLVKLSQDPTIPPESRPTIEAIARHVGNSAEVIRRHYLKHDKIAIVNAVNLLADSQAPKKVNLRVVNTCLGDDFRDNLQK